MYLQYLSHSIGTDKPINTLQKRTYQHYMPISSSMQGGQRYF